MTDTRRHACLLLGCIVALGLGGCMDSTRMVPVNHYQLSPLLATLKLSHPAYDPTGKVLQVTRILAPAWLAGTAMYYRLEYRNSQQLATYAHSAWTEPPALMLEPVIQRTIASRMGWRAVIDPDATARADSSLHIRLDDLSQWFATPTRSTGVIDATATLLDDHDGSVIAQHHFHIQVAAPTADAAGGAKALGAASLQLAGDVQHWLAGLHARDPGR